MTKCNLLNKSIVINILIRDVNNSITNRSVYKCLINQNCA